MVAVGVVSAIALSRFYFGTCSRTGARQPGTLWRGYAGASLGINCAHGLLQSINPETIGPP